MKKVYKYVMVNNPLIYAFILANDSVEADAILKKHTLPVDLHLMKCTEVRSLEHLNSCLLRHTLPVF